MSTYDGLKCDRKRALRIFFPCVLLLLLLVFFSSREKFQLATQTHKKFHMSTHFSSHKNSSIDESPQASNSSSHSDSPHGTSARKDTGFGYVFVSHYSDQMTGASLNIISMQCWASSISPGVKVVEPFLHKGSGFGVNLIPNTDSELQSEDETNLVRLRDVLDIENWERQTNVKGYAPLISWKEFLQHAPHDLILVSRECLGDAKKCATYYRKFNATALLFAQQHNFRIVRNVHDKYQLYTAQGYRDLVYGNFNPSRSVVLFRYWGGIYQAKPKMYRIGISDAKGCSRRSFLSTLFQTSEMIKQDGQHYMEQYMPEAIREGYISVMFRIERFGLNHNFKHINSTEKKKLMLADCVNNIGKWVDNLKKQFRIKTVFLSMDCRKQGSKAFRRPSGHEYLSNDLVNSMASMLYETLYGNTSSLEEWDESFDTIASFRTPGYLAQLQKYLASHGTCLLTAGGGSFQFSAEKLYNETLKHSDVNCAIKVPKC